MVLLTTDASKLSKEPSSIDGAFDLTIHTLSCKVSDKSSSRRLPMVPSLEHRRQGDLMFVANTRRPSALLYGVYRPNKRVCIERTLACLVVMIGAYGQIHDSFAPPASPWSDLHLGFGAALFCLVAVHKRAWIATCRESGELYQYAATCHSKRLIYILLYTLAGLRELSNIAAYLCHGGVYELGGIAIGHGSFSPLLHPPPIESFQIYLCYGAAAIFAIRASNGALHPGR